jgi:nucleoside-diphosphate-sugar epimerase
MKSVLVSGATGFIGNYLVRSLLRDGHRVIATSAHEDRARKLPWYGQVDYIPLDLSDFDQNIDYFQLLGRPDNMIHLAWEGLPNYRSEFHLEVNLPRHAGFLNNLIRHGLHDLTVTGTCLEYGMQEGCLTERLQARPDNPYAMAKDRLRLMLEQTAWHPPISLKWVRLFYIYGKGQNANSLFSQLDKALAGHEKAFNMSAGEQVRDYLSVETVADYLSLIANQQKVTGIVNCCSGQPVTVRKIVEDYLARTGQSIDLNLGYYQYPNYEPFRFWGDASKLKTILQNE